MIFPRIIFLLALVLVFFARTAHGQPVLNDGNALLRACTKFDEVADRKTRGARTDQEIQEMFTDTTQALICASFLQGVTYSHYMYRSHFKRDQPPFCLPEKATIGQAAKVIIKYLQDHPELLHRESIALIFLAFESAFPCAR